MKNQMKSSTINDKSCLKRGKLKIEKCTTNVLRSDFERFCSMFRDLKLDGDSTKFGKFVLI